MRLFAALDIPEEIRDEIAAWWTAASVMLPAKQWRDIPKDNWHLTLAFFGEASGAEVDDLAEALAGCAEATPPLSLCTGGMGVFPRPVRPRVFWAGIGEADDGKGLKNLARCCRQAGHVTLRKQTARETPFRGHVTLARVTADAAPLAAEIWADLPELPVLSWTSETLGLYASQLRPEGAIYRLVEAFELKGNQHVR
jgi:RNA 2',3'-cyclic 3'-phosphodiesterase